MTINRNLSLIYILIVISCLIISLYYLALLSNVSEFNVLTSLIHKRFNNLLLWEIALPRYFAVVLAGSALALAGYLFQVASRNILASPSLLGVGSGAHLALVVTLIFFPSLFEQHRIFISLFGGTVITLIIFGLCYKKDGQIHTIFIGTAVSLALSAIAAILSIYFENNVSGLFAWGAGDAEQQGWEIVSTVWKYILISILIALLFSKIIRFYELGDEVVQSLGIPLNTTKWFLLFLGTMLTCFAITLVGPISFIGLFVPNILRALGVQSAKLFMVLCLILGIFVLLLADTVTIMFEKYFYLNLPVGILTASLGAPILLWTMLRPGYYSINENKHIGLYGFSKNIKITTLLCIISSVLLVGVIFSSGLNVITDIANGYFIQKQTVYAFLYYEVYSPRIVLAILAGCALAVSGLFFQSIIQNTLASPEIIGVSQGATCSALIFTLFFPQMSWLYIQLSAFSGGIIAFFIIIFLATKFRLSPIQLAIVGISFGALYSAINMGILAMSGVKSSQILQWLSGSLYGQDWQTTLYFGLAFLAISPFCYFLSPWITRLSFGQEKAKSLGSNIQFESMLLLLLATLLTSLVVATVGMLSFIGLMAPHIARILGFTKPKELVIASAAIGGMFVAMTDMLVMFGFNSIEIPTGLILPIIGTTYLIWLLLKQKSAIN